jgi:hypothetical protein
MNLMSVSIEKPADVNVIVGQAHFIKTVEDLHEVLGAVPNLQFGVAFCESSGPRLIRRSGNDGTLVELATRAAAAIACGHCFVIMLRGGFPLSVLNPLKLVPEVCTVFCATANPVNVVVAEAQGGRRGLMGVIDGEPPLGVETEDDERERKEFLRRVGYKL